MIEASKTLPALDMNGSASDVGYKFIVDIDKSLWEDMDLSIEVGRIQHKAEQADVMMARAKRKLDKAYANDANDDTLEKLEDDYLLASDHVVEAYEAMDDIKKQVAEQINRIAAVTLDGQLVPAQKLPYHIIVKVQAAIKEAQEEAGNPKNLKPV